MRYRVEMDISFETEEQCLAMINVIKANKADIMSAIVPASPTLSMPKSLRYSQCRHDEDPPAQCGPYINVDWNA